jgi:hypothetical protein
MNMFKKSIESLKKENSIKGSLNNVMDKRKSVKIAVIDDQEFSPLYNLKNNKYDITPFNDITAIDQLEQYLIILCDLQGVGKKLNPSLQGAHLIAEIKKIYPIKYIIVYTGGGSQHLLNRSIPIADTYLSKDASIDEWISTLDNAITDLLDPIKVWTKMRDELLREGISLKHLVNIEDIYVRYYSDKDKFNSKLLKYCKSNNLSGEIQSMVGTLALNLMCSMLVSG